MNSDLLDYLICPECKQDKLDIEIYSGTEASIKSGRLICHACANWYRIENGIVDLLPLSLRRENLYFKFTSKHKLSYTKSLKTGEAQKESQIHFFAQGTNAYETHVTHSPYFLSLDKVVYEKWIEKNLPADSIVLDIGCGTGRQTLPLITKGHRVIGLDISEEMLILGTKKIANTGLEHRVDFIVTDAEKIPLKKEIVDGCIMAGALHHVKNPETVVQNAIKSVKINGTFFSYDPHHSPVRFIFDALMKFWKLYDEEARDDSHFTESQLQEILDKSGISGKTMLSTYIPPHFFYLFPIHLNVKILKATDSVCNRIPWIRKAGGMVVAEGKRIR